MILDANRISAVKGWLQAILLPAILVAGIGPIHHVLHLVQAHGRGPAHHEGCCSHHTRPPQPQQDKEPNKCPECQTLLATKPVEPAPIDSAWLCVFDPTENRIPATHEVVIQTFHRLPAIRGPPSFPVIL
jgi:hypothetical protein